MHVYRSALPFALGAAIGLLFPAIWIASALRLVDAPFATSVSFSLFTWGFAAPFTIHLIYLMARGDPVLSIYHDRIVVRSILFPWRIDSICLRDIVSVKARYYRNSSMCRLVVNLTEDAYRRKGKSKVWWRASGLHAINVWSRAAGPHAISIEMGNTTMTPVGLASILQARIG